MSSPFTFRLPDKLSAKEPPERRGIGRDRVRLMVIDRSTYSTTHSHFDQISRFLRQGDLLVFNSSRTLPAALSGLLVEAGQLIEARLAERLPDGSWVALLLSRQSDELEGKARAGMTIEFGCGLTGRILVQDERVPRLWRLRFSQSGTSLLDSIYRLGQPIRYTYIAAPWSLDYYQTVYATEPGSAEMPSAGRPFTWRLLFELRRGGIETAHVTLHTGLSSYMDDDLDRRHIASEEEYIIPDITAKKIKHLREKGGRIIAVGTTVVRALESIAAVTGGHVQAYHGYTRLQITAAHQLRIVHGLITGLHEPEASHLDLLCAFLPADVISAAYENAVSRNYLWHEFGDLNLIV
ncbi:MAG: S-adenosylmethionine:tRNA ribosyltransferase-isomerase [Verrucomicrobia bacterium]|nr:S-adenosylmethionine:tRNA ribosyltransferase-isomerase [Verrucomicrobiota bacterium]